MSLFINLRHPAKYFFQQTKDFRTSKSLLSTITTPSAFERDPFKASRCKVVVMTANKNSPTLDLAEAFGDAGARAIIVGTPPNEEFLKSAQDLNQKYGYEKIIVSPCDITKEAQAVQVFKLAHKLFQKIDIVVNSADIDGHVDHTIDLNIKSVLLGTLNGFNHMGINAGGSGGTIINVCSVLAMEPFYGCPVYVGTKYFILGFSRSMGTCYYYQQSNVKLITVCVGMTEVNTVPKTSVEIPNFQCLSYDKLTEVKKKPCYDSEEFKSCVYYILENGDNGSVWVVENNGFYQAKIPKRAYCIAPPS